jgi:putative sterol carrier protein
MIAAVPIDLDGPPARVYARVTELSDDEFAELMSDQASRDKIIDTLVNHMASQYVGDEDVDAVIHVKLWDRPGGGYDHRELVLGDGRCIVSGEPEHEARLTLKVRPEDLRRIVNGDAGPWRLALQRRLTVLGDIRFGMKLQNLFEL